MKPYETWLEKAQTGMNTAKEFLCDTYPPLDTVIQYALEAAVKALKAFLKFRGESFEEAGNLVELVDLCTETDPSFAGLTGPAEELAAYAIIFRDPAEAEIAPEKNEAAEAVRLAEEILKFTAAKINLVVINQEIP